MSEPLTPRDYDAILRALQDLHRLRDLAQLPPVILRILLDLIPSRFATYNEFNFRTGGVVLLCAPEDWNERMAAVMEAGHRLREQHPLWPAMQGMPNGQSLLISDVIANDAFRQTDFYRECLEPLGIAETMLLSLQMSSRALAFLCLNRERADFTPRDRRVADLLQPHILAAYDNAAAFTEARALAALSVRAIDESPHGIALIDGNGQVVHINAAAADLLAKYFAAPSSWRADLPPALRGWLAHRAGAGIAPPAPFEAGSNGRRLICRATDAGEGQRLLLFQEAAVGRSSKLETLGLSAREAHVMMWVAEGKTSREIGTILKISPRTVEKHLESIYRKLGVETRTAAVLKAIEQMSAPDSIGPYET